MSQRRSKPRFEIIGVEENSYTFQRKYSKIWIVMPPGYLGQTHVPKSAVQFTREYVRTLLVLRTGIHEKFECQQIKPDQQMRRYLFVNFGSHFSNPNKLLYAGLGIYWYKPDLRNEFYIAIRRA